MKNYLYNPNTHTIHIKGYCHHTKVKCLPYIAFATEDDVLAYDGRSAGMCKLCQNNRDKIMEEKK